MPISSGQWLIDGSQPEKVTSPSRYIAKKQRLFKMALYVFIIATTPAYLKPGFHFFILQKKKMHTYICCTQCNEFSSGKKKMEIKSLQILLQLLLLLNNNSDDKNCRANIIQPLLNISSFNHDSFIISF